MNLIAYQVLKSKLFVVLGVILIPYLKSIYHFRLIADFKAISTQSTDNPVNFVANPINSFLLIKKLAKDLQIIINKLSNYDRLKGILYEFSFYSDFR